MTKITVGAMDNNVYIIECTKTNKAIVIDAAANAPALLKYLQSQSYDVIAIVTTHEHADHWGALAELAEKLGVPTMASAGDGASLPVKPDPTLGHGDVIEVGDLTVEIIGLRGHTPDGIALVVRDGQGDRIFTGDSLFPGGPGRTFSQEDFRRLMTDLEERVFDRFPDHTRVHPGHGNDTTIGAERPQLTQWWERGF